MTRLVTNPKISNATRKRSLDSGPPCWTYRCPSQYEVVRTVRSVYYNLQQYAESFGNALPYNRAIGQRESEINQCNLSSAGLVHAGCTRILWLVNDASTSWLITPRRSPICNCVHEVFFHTSYLWVQGRFSGFWLVLCLSLGRCCKTAGWYWMTIVLSWMIKY